MITTEAAQTALTNIETLGLYTLAGGTIAEGWAALEVAVAPIRPTQAMLDATPHGQYTEIPGYSEAWSLVAEALENLSESLYAWANDDEEGCESRHTCGELWKRISHLSGVDHGFFA